jgi:hypothetical protein
MFGGVVGKTVAAYPAGAVARRLGVAVTTLRTWHQRYGVGPSLHVPGQHRRYTEQDVQRLEEMQRLIVEGVAPGEAARWVTRDTTYDRKVSIQDGETEAVVRGISRAAMRLDVHAIWQAVTGAVRDFGVVTTWESVLCPALIAVGEKYGATGELVEVEHLLSTSISAVLGSVPRPSSVARILLTCADEEQHSLPIEALSAALAEAGVAARMLGARMPPKALEAAIQKTGPLAVLIWSQQALTADPQQLSAVLEGRGRPVVVAAGGPGWSALPGGVDRPETLADALALLTSAAV